MSPSRQRFVTLLLATTGAAASFAHANEEPIQHQPNALSKTTSVNAGSVLDRAATLVSDGQVIRARAMILALQDSPAGVSLSDDQDQRTWKLLAQIERTLQRTDRHDIALQKAQHALSFDRLVDAERQAQTVFNSSKSTSEQIDRANAITSQIKARRDQATPLASSTLRSAIDSFNQGDYTRAKTIINRIGSLGLDLDSATRRKLAVYRSRIADLEQTRGETFGSPNPSMGMLAPESGASSEWLTSNAAEMLGQPSDEPGDDPVVEIIEVDERISHTKNAGSTTRSPVTTTCSRTLVHTSPMMNAFSPANASTRSRCPWGSKGDQPRAGSMFRSRNAALLCSG